MIINFGYLTEKEYENHMMKIKYANESKERKRKLREEKRKHMPKFKLPSTSKLILLGVFLMCIEVIIFCEYAMIVLADASAMYVLIGVPTTLIPVVVSYYNKSKAENTASGIVYEKAMRELNHVNEDLSGNDVVG